ncbi:MAG TPA: hypothetical protein VM901_09485 [Bdellovibrionota bacterium]|nr:hypothetical protein [Bdellovibrionota bacterium]
MGSRNFSLFLRLAGSSVGLLVLGACGLTFNPVHMPVVEATAQLLSPSITSKAVARMSLNCGSATEYWLIESSQIIALGKVPATYAPLATDTGWISCPSGDFSTNFTLPLTNNGVNTVHAFFKTGSDLYKHSETFAVRSLATSTNPYFALNDEPQEYEGFIDVDGCMMTCSGELIKLDNGYALVRPGFSSTPLEVNGKVTFYDRSMSKTFEYAGDEDWDMLGQSGVVPLKNGLVVVLSRWDVVNGIMGSGSAIFLDTKNPTSPFLFRIAGNEVNDQIGRHGAVELSSGLVAIRSGNDNVGGDSRGSVIFVDPTKPSSPEVFRINGDEDFDYLGQNKVIELSTGIVVIATMSDHVGEAPCAAPQFL